MGPGLKTTEGGGVEVLNRKAVISWIVGLVAAGSVITLSADNLYDMAAGPRRLRSEAALEVELREIRKDFDQHVQDAAIRFERMSDDTDAKIDRVLNKLDRIEEFLRKQGNG